MNRKEFLSISGLIASGLTTIHFTSFAKEKGHYHTIFGNKSLYDDEYDVVVVGGSYAGLSVSLTLARCLRKVLVIDAGQPRNMVAEKAQNALTMDGQPPDSIRKEALSQLAVYKDFLHLAKGQVGDVEKSENGFKISSSLTGETIAKYIVFATGASDSLPDIKGLKTQWGKNVHHCPYCHGFESRKGRTMLMTKDFQGLDLLTSLNHWSESLMVAMQTTLEIPDQLKSFFENQGIKWNISPVSEVVSNKEGELSKVIFEDGSIEQVDHIYLSTDVTYRTELAEKLGCEKDKSNRIETDDFMLTNQPGIYAIGDISSKSMGQIIWAANSGMMAGVHINNDMIKNSMTG